MITLWEPWRAAGGPSSSSAQIILPPDAFSTSSSPWTRPNTTRRKSSRSSIEISPTLRKKLRVISWSMSCHPAVSALTRSRHTPQMPWRRSSRRFWVTHGQSSRFIKSCCWGYPVLIQLPKLFPPLLKKTSLQLRSDHTFRQDWVWQDILKDRDKSIINTILNH